jgi:hypothetical protein
VVTRRAILGAGALALLAGCGSQEEPAADASAVLSEQLRVTESVVAAYAGGAARLNAEKRVERIQAALGQGGRTLHAAPGSTGLEAALAAEQAALRAHVAAVGELKAPEHRELLAGLIVDAAAGESALLAQLERPAAPTAFPGEPV